MTACSSITSEAVLSRPQPCDHLAYLYLDSDSLCGSIAQFVQGAFERSDAAIVIAVEPHTTSLLSRLQQAGLDCTSLQASGQLVCIDAESLLPTIMNGRNPDEAALRAAICPLLETARQRFPGVSVYGELVNLLWEQNNRAAAHRLEHWWNQLMQEQPFSLLCGYVVDIFDSDHDVQAALSKVCHCHSHIIPENQRERLEQAVNDALQRALPNADVPAFKQSMVERRRNGTDMPPAQAVLMALHELFPPLAQHVRMLAREYYNRC